MKLEYLPKLLLQHDDSPYLDRPDLIAALGDHPLAVCAHPRGLDVAIALGQRVVLLRAGASGEPPRFFTPVRAPESVTSLAWLWAPASGDAALAVGTSAGALQLHAPTDGALFHRQDIHDTPLLHINVRWSGSGLDPDDGSEDVTMTFSNAAARVPGYEIWPLIRWHTRATGQGPTWWGHGAGAAPQLAPTKWDLKGVGPRAAAAVAGPVQPPLSSLLSQKQDTHKYLLFTAGEDPPFSCYEVEEAPQEGLVSMVAGLASAGAAGLVNRAKGFLPGRRSSTGSVADPKSPGTAPAAAAPSPKDAKRKVMAGLATPPADTAVWDEKRRVVSVNLSPCCRWAAACDSLGRVCLVDVASCTVLRIFKGYRDAQAAWMIPSVSSSHSIEPLLVIYAPRRGSVELWRAHAGQRLGGVSGAPRRGALVAQPAVPASNGGGRGAGWRTFEANKVWMLDLEGLEMDELTPRLSALAAAAPTD